MDNTIFVGLSVYLKPVVRFLCIQRWIRFGFRFRLAKIMPHENYPFVVNFCGMKYVGNLDNTIDWWVYYMGGFEREELAQVKKYLNGAIVLDIGANTGQHTLFFSKYAETVYSFEPFPGALSVLYRRIKDNHIHNVRVLEVGLGDIDEIKEFYAPTGANKGIGSFSPEHSKSNKPIGKLKIRGAASCIQELHLPRIDFIKMDVEGYEKQLLRGIYPIIEKYRPVIMMEYEKNTLNLIPKGYTAHQLVESAPFLLFFNWPGGKLVPFKEGKTKGDVLLIPDQLPPSSTLDCHG